MEQVLSKRQSVFVPSRRSRSPGFRERLLVRWLDAIRRGHLTVDFPSGERRLFGDPAAASGASIVLHDLRVVQRLLMEGDIGLAESYVAGEWDTPDLTALLALGAANADVLDGVIAASPIATLLNRLRHAWRANTRAGSRRNIAAHYDLGNDFYGHWLDPSMTYSAALFVRGDESLIDAQQRKYRRLAARLNIRPGDRVLEIGCGWGGFAEVAAVEFGCEVVGLTLSREQAEFAHERIARAGLSEKVEIRIEDYRDVRGTFDHVVSIEMFEAVGQENWRTYFAALDRCLKPGGKAALQSITIADAQFDAYRRNPDFIQRYIFPGGMLPSPSAFDEAVRGSGLRVADSRFFGPCYAETLRRWRVDFEKRWPAIQRLGFDETFRRLWLYYLCYCEVGFDQGRVDVGQFLIERA